jgi:hypothetical protein
LAGNNSLLVDQATTQAQQASVCISTAGVSVKSLNGVLINLQSEIGKTQKYISFITTNQMLITQYNDLLGGKVPSQLVQLQNEYESL